MGARVFLLLVLSIAFVLLISSEVAARELAQTTVKTDGYNPRGEASNGGSNGGGGNGGGGNGGGGRGCHTAGACQSECCSAAELQALEASTQVKPQN